jgi:hypothetical protein
MRPSVSPPRSATASPTQDLSASADDTTASTELSVEQAPEEQQQEEEEAPKQMRDQEVDEDAVNGRQDDEEEEEDDDEEEEEWDDEDDEDESDEEPVVQTMLQQAVQSALSAVQQVRDHANSLRMDIDTIKSFEGALAISKLATAMKRVCGSGRERRA